VRLSLLLLTAALLPLAVVVGVSNYFARNTLIDQGRLSLSTDANGKASLVDAYLQERVLDGQALATLPTAQDLLACRQWPQLAHQVPPALAPYAPVLLAVMRCADPVYNLVSSQRALQVGIVRDANYADWSMYDLSAAAVTSTLKTPIALPQADGATFKQGKPFISGVRDNAQAGYSYVHLYTPIKLSFKELAQELTILAQTQAAQAQQGQSTPTPTPTSTQGQPASQVPLTPDQLTQLTQALAQIPDPTVGFLQATLKLNSIQQVVAGEQNANGADSSAFIADSNGVRIADPNANELFTSVAPLDPTTQQSYGLAQGITTDNLPAVSAAIQSTSPQNSFQAIAVPGAKIPYQFVGIHLHQVPWTYFVLSPLPTVTKVADDQLRTSLLSAAVVAVLAILLGLLVGTRTVSPVQRSVSDLRRASEGLNLLAARQQNSAGEQLWVVDACKTGLESVRYLSDAMHQAAHRIVEAGDWFGQYWDRLNEEQAQRTVQHLRELAQYIEEAARRQYASSERLDKAINVTTQVSDQLANGATAAAESAGRLEEVVTQLQGVVGGRSAARTSATDDPSQEPEEPIRTFPPALPAPSGVPGDYANDYSNQRAPNGYPTAAPASPYQGGWAPTPTNGNGHGNGNGFQQPGSGYSQGYGPAHGNGGATNGAGRRG
jgi:methyl-accepting chemotaxis protein